MDLELKSYIGENLDEATLAGICLLGATTCIFECRKFISDLQIKEKIHPGIDSPNVRRYGCRVAIKRRFRRDIPDWRKHLTHESQIELINLGI